MRNTTVLKLDTVGMIVRAITDTNATVTAIATGDANANTIKLLSDSCATRTAGTTGTLTVTCCSVAP